MQLIKHCRNQESVIVTSLIEIDDHKLSTDNSLFKTGELYLISYSDYDQNVDWFISWGFSDCGIKREKVELFRSLGFDRKGGMNKPLKLSVITSSQGALKRSISSFLKNRYLASDPACLLVINQELMSGLLSEIIVKKQKPVSSGYMQNKDPLIQLIEEAEQNPSMENICKTLLGHSFEMRLARALILKASQSTEPVLILGESGTGKDVVAHQIAMYDKKFGQNFNLLNCAALPETLLEAEMFGYKKGSHSGAEQDKSGLFIASSGGTIFLDELGELSLSNQAKLLVAVETKKIRQIGSNESIEVELRIICATNRNIDYMAVHEQFREDLLHRLNTIRIVVPPLRSHPEDIPVIADHIWTKLTTAKKLSKEFHQQLKSYHWPGNVRELKTLLSSIRDIFGDISPTPAHFHAIFKIRSVIPANSNSGNQESTSKILKLESHMRLTNLQSIIRGIKVAARPILNEGKMIEINKKAYRDLKDYLSNQILRIDELCMEPVYFIEYDLFKDITKFRYLLAKTIKTWPVSPDKFDEETIEEIKKLYEIITKKILELIWGKIDL